MMQAIKAATTVEELDELKKDLSERQSQQETRDEALFIVIEEKRRRLQSEAETREFKAKAREFEAKAREFEAKAQRELALRQGTNYSRIDELFDYANKRFDTNLLKFEFYEECCRHQEHQILCRRGAGKTSKPYQATLKFSGEALDPAIKPDQSTSNFSKKKKEIWKKAAVGSDPAGEIAHLVPSSVANANSYWFVTEFLFGIKKKANGMPQERDWDEIRRLIHGSNNAETGRREKNTGIKRMVSNRVLLAGQRDYFDNAPCVLIIPVLSREDAISWAGAAYDAIMMIDAYKNLDGEEIRVESVASLTFFCYDTGMDTTVDIEGLNKAIGLLRDYTRAILYAQKFRKPSSAGFDFDTSIANVSKAYYPLLTANPQSLKVRKISFEDNNSSEGHPAPDPLLLVTKAVAVLQKRRGFKIVAAMEPDDNGSMSELTKQAMEEYLLWRESSISYPDPIGFEVALS